MQLITSPKVLDKTVQKLLEKYLFFDAACAWAGVGFDSYKALLRHQDRCRRIVIGTHFFQTHPDFIASVITNRNIRFVKCTNELFHPKAYLFYNNPSDWHLLIGSANFTKAAFSTNSELTFHITADDDQSGNILQDFETVMAGFWKDASHFTQPELNKYRAAWTSAKTKRNSLSREYDERVMININPLDVKILTMTWSEYLTRLLRSRTDLKMRIELLAHVRKKFEKYASFRLMPTELRKFIAGVQNKYESGIDGAYDPWMAFGNMSGSGTFANRVIHNEDAIWRAIDCIPLVGEVARDEYVRFFQQFTKFFSESSIATGTRLLAMKRPDIFYCLTSANQERFCKDFNLRYSQVNLSTYWDLVVMPIQDSEWWLHPNPANSLEESIKLGRAAFLDSIYYIS